VEERDWRIEHFEENRGHLRAVAYRMLGSRSEADDAVQEAWLRLGRSDTSGVENLKGWLTTVVAHVCLDMLRSRDARREEPLTAHEPDLVAGRETGVDAEHEALIADSVGIAMLVVLETLEPAERLAFVLHDLFAVPFDEIATIVGRSPAAARQLASRARRRVQNASAIPNSSSDLARRRKVVEAFLAASRGGNFDALLELLDPGVVLRADAAVVNTGALKETRGAVAVAQTFSGRAKAARLALVNGVPSAVWAAGGKPRVVFEFTIAGEKVVAIELVSDPEHLAQMEVEFL
jgi:RNA polymerase sigma factor (sigma-70 family)